MGVGEKKCFYFHLSCFVSFVGYFFKPGLFGRAGGWGGPRSWLLRVGSARQGHSSLQVWAVGSLHSLGNCGKRGTNNKPAEVQNESLEPLVSFLSRLPVRRRGPWPAPRLRSGRGERGEAAAAGAPWAVTPVQCLVSWCPALPPDPEPGASHLKRGPGLRPPKAKARTAGTETGWLQRVTDLPSQRRELVTPRRHFGEKGSGRSPVLRERRRSFSCLRRSRGAKAGLRLGINPGPP